MSKVFYLEKNVITPEERESLISMILEDLQADQRPHYMGKGFQNHDLFNLGNESHEPLRKVVKICGDTFLDKYSMNHNHFELHRLFGNVMDTGAINHPHDDDGDNYPDKPENTECYSAILMLNNEYEGGELYFPNQKEEIRLDAGDLVMFRGNAENLHGVREVTGGKRINVIIFFRNIPVDPKPQRDFWKEFTENYKG
jgi:hypothetical protein